MSLGDLVLSELLNICYAFRFLKEKRIHTKVKIDRMQILHSNQQREDKDKHQRTFISTSGSPTKLISSFDALMNAPGDDSPTQ